MVKELTGQLFDYMVAEVDAHSSADNGTADDVSDRVETNPTDEVRAAVDRCLEAERTLKELLVSIDSSKALTRNELARLCERWRSRPTVLKLLAGGSSWEDEQSE
ncbi:hypothetical protein Cch02nite_38450 [Catellatospora chokoriensis]|uniref:Uncharacterized protein n=1 Tax=Catellatospora chokoriensis TaxID=310353 RepID=A0A8J3NSC6_9ACTN|nr:hypothetical protein Cch02nite_38450 [Catellatospora chokoriensis]